MNIWEQKTLSHPSHHPFLADLDNAIHGERKDAKHTSCKSSLVLQSFEIVNVFMSTVKSAVAKHCIYAVLAGDKDPAQS
jgi:hypothetical protein